MRGLDLIPRRRSSIFRVRNIRVRTWSGGAKSDGNCMGAWGLFRGTVSAPLVRRSRTFDSSALRMSPSWARLHSSPPQFDFPGPQYTGAYLERRREVGWQLYRSVGVAQGDRIGAARQALENFRLFGAPHVAIISTNQDLGVYGAVDCGAYVGNFVLLAQSLGIASIPQAALAQFSPFVREYFRLGADRRIVCGISFGYEDRAHAANQFRTRRANLDEAVTWVVD